MALACALLGDRWTMLVIREAFYGVSRFADLQEDLQIPRGVLADRLKRLVEHGVLKREAYRDGNTRPRHEYRLTESGQDLGLTLIALMQWGDRHLQDEPSSLRVLSRTSGEPLQVALVTPDGRAVSFADVAYAIADQKTS